MEMKPKNVLATRVPEELGEMESSHQLRRLRAAIDKKQISAKIDELLGDVPSRSVEERDRVSSGKTIDRPAGRDNVAQNANPGS